MKYLQQASVIFALLYSTHQVEGLKIREMGNDHYQMIQKDTTSKITQQLESMKDEEIQKLIQQAIDQSKKDNKNEDLATKKDEAIAKDAEMKAVEATLAKRILNKLTYPYDGVLRYPLDRDIATKIAAIHAYHDLILNYELNNAIAGLVDPTLEEVSRVLRVITDTSGMQNNKASSNQTAPVQPSFVQLDSQLEGVPVLVNPTLLTNEADDVDLSQRNYVIDGVNGFSFVQQKDDVKVPNAQTLLQTQNPVVNPPFNNWSVNQPSPLHNYGMKGDEDLGLREIIVDGVNYDLVQTSNPVVNPPFNNWSVHQPSPPHDHGLSGKEDLGEDIIVQGDKIHFGQILKPEDDENVVLQVKGVPVLVNPTLMTNDVSDSDLMQRNIIIDGVSGYAYVQQKDSVTPPSNDELVVLQVNGVPVYVNPDSMLLPNYSEKYNFGHKIEIGLDDVTYTQTSNPVVNPPFNNWSVNQPSPAHNFGMKGDEDLGLREIIVDGVNYDLVQLNNPVVNPPFNNWSINQPSPAHNHGMKGDEDLGLREIIIDGVNYDLVQTKKE